MEFFISSGNQELIFRNNGERFNWGHSTFEKYPLVWGLYYYQIKQKNLFENKK